jgi:DivIVA domain-containing protein
MATVLLVLVVVLVVAALVYGIVSLLSGEDPGLEPVEPDGRAVPLANDRSLTETDLKTVRFDLAWRGYRMSQVDLVLRRTAYDLGYKDEMIAVLEAEVAALRDGRLEDADLLAKARLAAASPTADRAEPVIHLDLDADEASPDEASPDVAGTDGPAEAPEQPGVAAEDPDARTGEPAADEARTSEPVEPATDGDAPADDEAAGPDARTGDDVATPDGDSDEDARRPARA